MPVSDTSAVKQIKLVRQWKGPLCQSRLVNAGKESVRVKEVVLFDLAPSLPPETQLYGEGFQMLTQTGGTLGQPTDLGNYTDAKHYKLPTPDGARTCYGLITLGSPEGGNSLLAFTSCRRFIGQFYLRDSSLQVVMDTEGNEIKPGESWELEEFTFRAGPDREQLLAELARRLVVNHPPLRLPTRQRAGAPGIVSGRGSPRNRCSTNFSLRTRFRAKTAARSRSSMEKATS